jgi:hypothetical protein
MRDESETSPRVGEREALASELADLRGKFEQAERRAGEPAVVVAAIDQAQRDRDALTSPQVEDLRETVEELCDDLEAIWTGLVHTLQNAVLLAKESPKTHRPDSLLPSLEDAVATRKRLMEQLEAAGIDYLAFPKLPSYANLSDGLDDGAR